VSKRLSLSYDVDECKPLVTDWVPNCDTLHALIREHRDAHKVPLNLEHRLMLAMAPDYDHLPLVNKVEVFEHALENTPGNDLAGSSMIRLSITFRTCSLYSRLSVARICLQSRQPPYLQAGRHFSPD
jgi:hypothetical protein